MHATLPAFVLYLPATQFEQAPNGPVLPASHEGTVHPFTDDVPLNEFVPAGQAKQYVKVDDETLVEYFPVVQSTQAAEPIAPLYLPATHAKHELSLFPFGPVYPLLHTH